MKFQITRQAKDVDQEGRKEVGTAQPIQLRRIDNNKNCDPLKQLLKELKKTNS